MYWWKLLFNRYHLYSQVPTQRQDVQTITEDGIYFKAQQSNSPLKNISSNAILHKIFGLDQSEKHKKVSTTQGDIPKVIKRSPRILITRAYSEESEKNSKPNTPNREISKIHSTSATTLLDKKWRNLRYKVSPPLYWICSNTQNYGNPTTHFGVNEKLWVKYKYKVFEHK